MKLVIFDFDGTLTQKDSFVEFIKFSKGKLKFYSGFMLLLPVLILYKARLIKNWRAKEMVLQYFFKNTPFQVFENHCHDFALNHIHSILKPEAMLIFEKRIAENAKVIIVTASPENWVKPWSARYNIQTIGTRLKVYDGKITGEIEGKNCYGPEKAIRLMENVDLSHYTEIEVYGDSRGDRELMDLATTVFYKRFPK